MMLTRCCHEGDELTANRMTRRTTIALTTPINTPSEPPMKADWFTSVRHVQIGTQARLFVRSQCLKAL